MRASQSDGILESHRNDRYMNVARRLPTELEQLYIQSDLEDHNVGRLKRRPSQVVPGIRLACQAGVPSQSKTRGSAEVIRVIVGTDPLAFDGLQLTLPTLLL